VEFTAEVGVWDSVGVLEAVFVLDEDVNAIEVLDRKMDDDVVADVGDSVLDIEDEILLLGVVVPGVVAVG
jgi:hypothetical protein